MWGAHVVFFALAVEIFVRSSSKHSFYWPRTAATNKTNCLVCLKKVKHNLPSRM